MAERYSFALSDTFNDVDTSLNEHYVTAIEETHYFSGLDGTNEITLEDLTLPSNKLEDAQDFKQIDAINGEEAANGEEASESEVVVYSVEGSDELFGVQTVRDEEGNVQKYRFQFCRNDDGQLEAIPETIQLLTLDDEILTDTVEETEDHNQIQLFVTGNNEDELFVTENNEEEDISPDHETFAEPEEATEETETYEDDLEEDEYRHEDIDIKPLISSVKEEIQIEYDSLSQMAEEQELVAEAEINEEYQRNLIENNISLEDEENATGEENVSFMEHYQHIHEQIPEENEDDIEHVEVNPDLDLMQEGGEHTDDENEEYDIAEGLHITAETACALSTETLEKDTNSNILKQALKMNQQQNRKDRNSFIFYLVQKPEKENVNSLSLDAPALCPPRVNPRSILKSSHGMLHPVNEFDQYQNKRFFKCKEAQQARSFHSYINKTTIPQAPIRKNRLPRKQKISPVERQDEEIVVQQVMVGSNGFVEAVNEEDLPVLDYVNLADSDEESEQKRSDRRTKNSIITISDTEESEEIGVIDLIESEDENHEATTATKRKRGRPPKNGVDPPLKKQLFSDIHTSPRRPKETYNDDDEVPIPKPEIPCTKCDKTFPSQNSLKTHLQHHNLQYLSKATSPLVWKYKCTKCGEQFKNRVLEQRHTCKISRATCAICFKKFTNIEAFQTHRRVHLKDHMVKSTTNILELPPKRELRLRFDTTNLKSFELRHSRKCKVCSKECSSVASLQIHLKSHKQCGKCMRLFVSELMLQKHIVEKCVKSSKRISHFRVPNHKDIAAKRK